MSEAAERRGSDVRNNRHETVPFPAELTGYIIGAGGNGIRSLRDRSGVDRAWIEDHAYTQHRRQFSIIHFVGNPVNVDNAKLQLIMRVTDAIHNQASQQQQPGASGNSSERRRDRDRSPGPA